MNPKTRRPTTPDLFLTQAANGGTETDLRCTQCAALCESRTQVVLPTPTPPGGLLVIGEAPGADEDLLGYGFAGQAGNVLVEALSGAGIGPYSFGRANICRCRPPDNRRPKREEIEACLPRLSAYLLESRPRVVLTIGGTATVPLLGRRNLFDTIHMQFSNGNRLPAMEHVHPLLRESLQTVRPYIVPMPHTSGLAWNRTASNGERWSQIGLRQVIAAASLLSQAEVV